MAPMYARNVSLSVIFYAISWPSWRKASASQRARFIVEPPDPGAVRELSADHRVREWKYASAAGTCWESMRSAIDEETKHTYDEVFGALFWEGPHGLRRDLPEIAAKLALDPDSVVSCRRSLVHEDVDGLEPFFDALCPRDGRFATFGELRRYVAKWAALLARVEPGEALIAE